MPEFRRVSFDPDFLSYEAGLALQREVHSQVVKREIPDTVLLLEHESVYTAGKRTQEFELPNNGSRFIETDRGGKITWHGPGQLVGYPIMHLPQPIDVVGYVRYLEQAIIDSVAHYGVEGFRVKGRTGVWVNTQSGEAKLAAIGIRVAEKVTMHGFALNCSNSLEPYNYIVACGLVDAKSTTLSELTGARITPWEVATLIESKLGDIPNVRG